MTAASKTRESETPEGGDENIRRIGQVMTRMRLMTGRRVIGRLAIQNVAPGMELSHLDVLEAVRRAEEFGEVTVGTDRRKVADRPFARKPDHCRNGGPRRVAAQGLAGGCAPDRRRSDRARPAAVTGDPRAEALRRSSRSPPAGRARTSKPSRACSTASSAVSKRLFRHAKRIRTATESLERHRQPAVMLVACNVTRLFPLSLLLCAMGMCP